MFEKIDVDAGVNAETDDSIGDDVGFSSCGNLVDERKAVIGDTGLNVENRRVVGLIFELVTKHPTTHTEKKEYSPYQHCWASYYLGRKGQSIE